VASQGECTRNKQPVELLREFDRYFIGGEREFINEMMTNLIKIKDPCKKIHYGEKVFRMKHGDKTRIQAQVEPGSLTIFDLITAFKEERKKEKLKVSNK
jgi:hypothetical protein